MEKLISGIALTALCAGVAHAGGVERADQSVAILFEEGTYAELSFGAFNGDVSGRGPNATFTGLTGSGDMSPGFGNVALGFKQAVSETIDVALILDQPIGADIKYPAGTGYIGEGATASLDANAITALVRYRLPSNVSLIGGVRALRTSGEADLPYIAAPFGYALSTSTETDFGYVIGIAWERPEIAARVALTYNSAITHDFDSTEEIAGITAPGGFETVFETEIPQSVNLEFQTGVAEDTLLFGSIRWVDWTSFDIDPELYNNILGEPLVFYTDDVITYNLGLGRKFTDQWSGAILLGYEENKGDLVGNLGPTDGFTSVGVAATYTQGPFEITGGIRYVDIGDATTRNILAEFDDNEGWGAGLRIGYRF